MLDEKALKRKIDEIISQVKTSLELVRKIDDGLNQCIDILRREELTSDGRYVKQQIEGAIHEMCGVDDNGYDNALGYLEEVKKKF